MVEYIGNATLLIFTSDFSYTGPEYAKSSSSILGLNSSISDVVDGNYTLLATHSNNEN